MDDKYGAAKHVHFDGFLVSGSQFAVYSHDLYRQTIQGGHRKQVP